MKIFPLICCISVQILLVSSSNIIGRFNASNLTHFDKEETALELVKFLEPYKTNIQKWFWEISGNSYNSPHFKNDPSKIGTMAEYITCEICVPALPLLKVLIQVGFSSEDIIGVITVACQVLNLAPKPEICEPTIRSYATPILYMVTNKPEIPDDDFCGIINPGCRPISAPVRDWSINIAPPTPKGLKTRKTLPKDGLPKQTELTKILQFTDLHLDLDYVVGTDSGCGLPACCRDGVPTNPDNAAGKWGHFSCEMPEAGLKALYEHAAITHSDAKFIFLTGDYIHSNIWLYGVDENTRHHVAITTLLQSTFASISPEIYPLVGNHEPDIVNMYPPEETWGDFPLRWMYHSVADAFGPFLPEDQMELFLKYGYYSVTSKSDENLRIIALNTNLCYVNNFWLPYEPIDTSGQLQWFADRLQEAENAGQAVFLLGHIFPGSGSCWPVWSRQFERIIQRYSETIRAQWYGHSHEQDYHLAFSEDNSPVSLSVTGGSGVTDGMNPGYNVFYADGARGADSTWEIVNQQTIVLNLTHSNAQPDEDSTPTFDLILDAQEMWGVTSLTAETVYDLIYRMVCDDALFLEYQKVKTKGADSPRFNPCLRNDYRCKANLLGGLLVSNSGDNSHRDMLIEYILTVDCSGQDPPTTTPNGGSTGSTAGSSAGTTDEPEGTTAGSGGKSLYIPLFLAVLIKLAVL